MRLLALATVTADGRPIVGPVDGIFFRGSFHFGSSPDSVRFRHIARAAAGRARPSSRRGVAVTVHGRADPYRPAELGATPSSRQALPSTSTCPATGRSGRRTFLDSGPGVRAHRRGPDVHLPDGSLDERGAALDEVLVDLVLDRRPDLSDSSNTSDRSSPASRP